MIKAFRTGNNAIGFRELLDYVSRGRKLDVLEIGCAYGEGTEMILAAGHNVTCVDYRVPKYAAGFDERIDHSRITLYEGLSHEVLRRLTPNSYDLAYIDADHRFPQALMDICLSYCLVREGGYQAGHDYKFEGVQQAVDLMFGKPDRVFCDSSWLVAKP